MRGTGLCTKLGAWAEESWSRKRSPAPQSAASSKSTAELHKAAVRQVYDCLRVSNLELGLLLHFGPDPKFYRVYAPNEPETGR